MTGDGRDAVDFIIKGLEEYVTTTRDYDYAKSLIANLPSLIKSGTDTIENIGRIEKTQEDLLTLLTKAQEEKEDLDVKLFDTLAKKEYVEQYTFLQNQDDSFDLWEHRATLENENALKAFDTFIIDQKFAGGKSNNPAIEKEIFTLLANGEFDEAEKQLTDLVNENSDHYFLLNLLADFYRTNMLYGKAMHSERPQHRKYEQWHPIGPVGVISAFNFPVAVWSWNAFIAAICGNTTIWKPSSQTPLCAIAGQHICNEVLKAYEAPGIFSLLIGGGSSIGETLINDKDVPLISFTGSTRMGKRIAQVVGSRLGKTIFELGGNNAIIVDETAKINMVVPAILFGAVGTAGQRCTSTRRINVQQNICDQLIEILILSA